MADLSFYANIAEILGTLTIIGGGVFGAVQLLEFRGQRRDAVAVELMRSFYNPEFSRAVTLIRNLPDDISAEDLRARGPAPEEAALLICMMYETMGLLVYRRIASFGLAQELTGGLLEVLWRKLGVWVATIRTRAVASAICRVVRVARDPVREARQPRRAGARGLSGLETVKRFTIRPSGSPR